MSGITNSKLVSTMTLIFLLMVPLISLGRDNSLTGGLSLGFDYSDRNYDRVSDDPDTPLINEALESGSDSDDYKRIVLTPLIHFTSLSERDGFELRTAPGIRYDLDDYETDWDNNLYVAVNRFFTQSWEVRLSNRYIKTDYYDQATDSSTAPADTPPPVTTPTSDPQLSPDIGRTRYWRNTLDLYSDYTYREDSLFQLGFSYIALRNDDTGIGGAEDYDRYTASLLNEHRFNSIWSTTVSLGFVRGDFDPPDEEVVEAVVEELVPDAGVIPTDGELSNDLKEYRLLLGLENQSIALNPITLNYNYIGAQYDDALQDDSDIHQMRLSWRREISPRMYTNLGIGPSYGKIEGKDEKWDYNGIAELNYRVERGYYNFLVEKRFDVDNFSGSDESGAVDLWDAGFSCGYQLLRDLNLTGRLSYLWEDRESPVLGLGRALSTEDPLATIEVVGDELEQFHMDTYRAGVGLTYTFSQFYTAGIDYTYTKVDSDRVREDYDDHRILLTLSWQKELFHW